MRLDNEILLKKGSSTHVSYESIQKRAIALDARCASSEYLRKSRSGFRIHCCTRCTSMYKDAQDSSAGLLLTGLRIFVYLAAGIMLIYNIVVIKRTQIKPQVETDIPPSTIVNVYVHFYFSV